MATFQYFPLNVSLREIRLLVVRPAAPDLRDSPLEVSLIKSRLRIYRKEQRSEADEESPLKYMALSYTWGDPQPTFSVLLDGMEFKIRKNLYEALLHFRPTKGELAIWIDAVCINQGDMQERESQVALMRDIYKEAEGVWAWLGPGDATKSRAAFMFLADLAYREYSDVKENPRRANITRSETIEWVKSKATSDASIMRWLELAYLLESPWFSRMWIIQEVVMGKTVTVVSGSQATPFDEVIYYGGEFIDKYLSEVQLKISSARRRNYLTKEFDKRAENMFLSARCIAEIGRARVIRIGQDPKVSKYLPKTVYQVVRHFGCFNVTDPRDKVYALLGILEEFGNDIKCPTISYSIPLVNLCWEIIKSHIEHNRNLDFLRDAVGLDKPCGTPTWMPHWYDNTKNTNRATPLASLQLEPEIEYKATANTLPFCSFYPRLKAIRAAGFAGAVVSEVGDVANLPDPGTEDPEAYYSQAMEHLSRICGQWVSMLDLDDVFKGQLPYILNFDDFVPKEKRGKAYTFMNMLHMIEDFYKWSDEKLYALYERRIENEKGAYLCISSAKANYSARLLATTSYRRLFISVGKTFGLGPKEMRPGDMIVYLYGCRVPMVLRLVDGLKMWRIVGEAYCPYDMNGEQLEPENVAMRATAGLPDMLFWII